MFDMTKYRRYWETTATNGEWNSYFIVEKFFSVKLASFCHYQRRERFKIYEIDMSESKERGKVIKSPNNVSNI